MEYLDTTMRIFGYITGTGAGIAVLYKLYMWFRKPSTDNSSKIAKHEEEIKDLQEKVQKDYESINEIKNMQTLLVKSMMELIDNRITGNNIEGLKTVKKELVEYLKV